MNLKDFLIAARSALLPVSPNVYLRDAIPRNAEGEPILPDRCIIIDLVTDEKVRDFESLYSVISLQVGCWSTSIADSLDDLEAARAALEASDMELLIQRVHSTQTDPVSGHRGAVATFSTLY